MRTTKVQKGVARALQIKPEQSLEYWDYIDRVGTCRNESSSAEALAYHMESVHQAYTKLCEFSINHKPPLIVCPRPLARKRSEDLYKSIAENYCTGKGNLRFEIMKERFNATSDQIEYKERLDAASDQIKYKDLL